MTDPLEQLKQQLPVDRLSIEVLFALRVLFDKPEPTVNLHQDIADLTHFPDRLYDSYRPEWESYVKRALVEHVQAHPEQASDELIAELFEQIDTLQRSHPDYSHWLGHIEDTQALLTSPNAHIFPTPWRQQIMALLLPVSTLRPPRSDN